MAQTSASPAPPPTRLAPRRQQRPFTLLALGLSWALLTGSAAAADAKTAQLRSQLVGQAGPAQATMLEGAVEALRHTVVSAQVAGAIVELPVKAGDRVRAGQLLMRIDARAAEQSANASAAQAEAARASLHLASREYERQQLLFKQHFISQAALDQAEAQFKATQAQVNAQLAQLALARTQSGFNTVRSPYDAVIAELPVALGDMAMPGRALLSLYDPSALRVTARLPQSLAKGLSDKTPISIEIAGQPKAVPASRIQLLPTIDAQSHTLELRLDLPALPGLAPGQFARVLLPAGAATVATLSIPVTAVQKRAELSAVYVINAEGKPLLRQLRLGARQGDQIEVLSGLSAGERIALDPQAAALLRSGSQP
ncbi:efflux RND transporter periplasmic adaptor subunit [Paucibacter sp. APW11]|uniref:Efflux RND transporter periplasmic adaptor subunit n=1 Tax=Roseateles aquae TaxID=3077235 RepID=A0ABU3P554_9BURK|nr:efflux RND transporter periplasmic adaptor subunit [Paucibacter sp. APW11]MDT8997708.1 efflux RND transporter periplasmic adaptor subunit [Paucibacter sp. APW11]